MKKLIFKRIWTGLGNRKLLNFVSDKTYLKIAYYTKNLIKLNLDNPKTYFEKLNWLKIHYRDDSYSKIVDKAEFKNYVAEKLGAGGGRNTLLKLSRYMIK